MVDPVHDYLAAIGRRGGKAGTCMNKAAQALGRLARGVPKKISPAESAARRARLAAARAKRWPGRRRRPHV